MQVFDCAIIGAGPAGLAAALQAKRQGLVVALLEKDRPGGQALAANLIENFPGFPGGITGPELMNKFVRQVEAHGVNVKKALVSKVERRGSGFNVIAENETISAKTVIIACGLSPKKLGVPGEDELIGRRIFYYVDPAGLACNGKRIVVIGSGDAAFDQAINFARCGGKVSILMRGSTPRCITKLTDDTKRWGVKVISKASVICFAEKTEGLVIELEGGPGIDADICDICIGKESAPELWSGASTPGFFFAGDCLHGRHRHIAIATGDGTLAALKAADFINENHLKTR